MRITYPGLNTVASMTALTTLLLAGCGSSHNNAPSPTATLGTSGANLNIGNTINYGSFGTTTEIDCGDGKSLNIGGSNNTLTITGVCASVNIGGADNTLVFDTIDQRLSVIGLNNTIRYRNGDPTVNNLGQGNTITKS